MSPSNSKAMFLGCCCSRLYYTTHCYVHACTCMCMYVCMYVHIRMCTYALWHMCICMSIHACVCVCAFECEGLEWCDWVMLKGIIMSW